MANELCTTTSDSLAHMELAQITILILSSLPSSILNNDHVNPILDPDHMDEGPDDGQ